MISIIIISTYDRDLKHIFSIPSTTGPLLHQHTFRLLHHSKLYLLNLSAWIFTCSSVRKPWVKSFFFFSYSNHIISSHLHDTKGLTRPLPPLLQLQAMYLKLLTASKLNFPLTVGFFVATRLKFWLLVSYVSLGVITHFMRCHYYWYTTYNRLMILMTILPLFCP